MRRRWVLWVVVLLVSCVWTATPALADPKSPKPAGNDETARVDQAVRDAVARGPADVLVSLDPSTGVDQAAQAMGAENTRSGRAAAARAATAAYTRSKSALRAAVGSGLSVKRDYGHLPVQVLHLDSPAALDALAERPEVTAISLPSRLHKVSDPAWLSITHQPQAVSAGYTGQGVGVAVLDSGAAYTDPATYGAFGNCSAGIGKGSCRIAKYLDTGGSGELDVDPDRHGTNVTGIVGTVAPQSKLYVYNVFSNDGGDLGAWDTDILDALDDVAANAAADNIRAVNLSLGDSDDAHPRANNESQCSGAYESSFLGLRALGVVPVVAAGNYAYDDNGHFSTGIAYPACAAGAVRVGAVYAAAAPTHQWFSCTDSTPVAFTIACFSQTGPLLSVLAPGIDISAAGIQESGTSQATPNVAGAVADLVSANPQATAAQLVRALTTSGPLITDPRSGTRTHLLDIAAAAVAAKAPAAEVTDSGCRQHTLPASDDGTAGPISLGFPAKFYGATYSSLYVNTNGNVTFKPDQQVFVPFDLGTKRSVPIIAPFLADVDTRGPGSGRITYGTTTVGSRTAFCVNWNNVGYYDSHADKRNSFQLLLVDRGDTGAGDFDVVMNYNTITWEAGGASGGYQGLGGTAAVVGYSAGDGSALHVFQLPGSQQHLALLDNTSSTGLVDGSRGTLQNGRYIFPVRAGAPPGSAVITGTVQDQSGNPVGVAPVQACPAAGSCVVGVTGGDGHYSVPGLNAGSWTVTAFPPADSALSTAKSGSISVTVGATRTVNLTLIAPTGPSTGATVTGTVVDLAGQPIGGATVTLQRADTGAGPFTVVPDGSAVLTPGGRQNPLTTDGGTFRWDTIAGYYRVQASKAGCHVPAAVGATATSAVYEVSSAAAGIRLVLDCRPGHEMKPCTTAPFWDVAKSAAFCPEITWLASTGITTGYSDPGHGQAGFHPASSVSRQAMAAFLSRYGGQPDPVCTGVTRRFTDVPAGGFCGPIEWLAGTGITQGYSDGGFHPTDNVSRQAMAAFLYRLANPGQTAPACTTQQFWDVPVNSPFCKEIAWLASTGITTGYANPGHSLPGFHPTASVTRQAMAAFLYRVNDFDII